jgi:hypothetical protein
MKMKKFKRFRQEISSESKPRSTQYNQKEPINWMDLIFSEINRNKEIKAKIRKNLETFSIEELREMASSVLLNGLMFFRSTSEINSESMNKDFIDFQLAVNWHLADSLHNVPEAMYAENNLRGDKPSLIYYLSEYFNFLHVFEQLEDKPNFYYYRKYYTNFQIKEEWKLLYEN